MVAVTKKIENQYFMKIGSNDLDQMLLNCCMPLSTQTKRDVTFTKCVLSGKKTKIGRGVV